MTEKEKLDIMNLSYIEFDQSVEKILIEKGSITISEAIEITVKSYVSDKQYEYSKSQQKVTQDMINKWESQARLNIANQFSTYDIDVSKYSNYKITGITNNNNSDPNALGTGFYGITIIDMQGNVFITSRGSEIRNDSDNRIENIIDWIDNLRFPMESITPQQKDAIAFLKSQIIKYENMGVSIELLGHSKGGNNMLIAAAELAKSDPKLFELIAGLTVYNAPGLNKDYVKENKAFIEMLEAKLNTYVTTLDIVSRISLLYNLGKETVIKAEGGFFQHQSNTFLTSNGNFILEDNEWKRSLTGVIFDVLVLVLKLPFLVKLLKILFKGIELIKDANYFVGIIVFLFSFYVLIKIYTPLILLIFVVAVVVFFAYCLFLGAVKLIEKLGEWLSKFVDKIRRWNENRKLKKQILQSFKGVIQFDMQVLNDRKKGYEQLRLDMKAAQNNLKEVVEEVNKNWKGKSAINFVDVVNETIKEIGSKIKLVDSFIEGMNRYISRFKLVQEKEKGVEKAFLEYGGTVIDMICVDINYYDDIIKQIKGCISEYTAKKREFEKISKLTSKYSYQLGLTSFYSEEKIKIQNNIDHYKALINKLSSYINFINDQDRYIMQELTI